MTGGRTYFLCLLSVVVSLQLTASLNLDDLCARRCLYGRGGILCNCNAMHFNGKRSGQVNYITDNTHHDFSDAPIDFFNKESSALSERSKFESLLKTNQDSHLQRAFLGDSSDILDASLTSLRLEKLLSRLDEEAGTEILSTDSNSDTDDSHVKDADILRGLVGGETHSETADEDEETEDILERRREIASTIKEIMANWKTSTSDSDDSADLLDDIVDDTQNDSSRQQLVRFNDVLQRARERS